MNFKLDDNVWFGNWESPIELNGQVKTIINVASSFSNRRGRNVYWQRLEDVTWDAFYVRLAKRDHDPVDMDYLNAIISAVGIAVAIGKLPILCHCQMGGHRGPTAAVCATWVLGGKTGTILDKMIDKAEQLWPRYIRSRETPYRKTMVELMRSIST